MFTLARRVLDAAITALVVIVAFAVTTEIEPAR